MYTLTSLIIILAIMSIAGWDGWIRTYRDIQKPVVVIDNHSTTQ